MSDPFATAEQLCSTVQLGSGPALALAQALLQAGQTVPPAEGADDLRYQQSLSGAVFAGPADVRLCREEGSWQTLGVILRPDGGCLVDVDGESYRIMPDGAILDEAAQDRRFDETVEKFETASEQMGEYSPLREAPASNLADWAGLAASLLGLGATSAAAITQSLQSEPEVQPTGPTPEQRAGVEFLGELPLRLAMGEEQELQVAVYAWDAEQQQLTVDEQALSCLQFDLDSPLAAAQTQFTFQELRGEAPARHAVYRARAGVALPGDGFCLSQVRVSTDTAERSLPIALQLHSADWPQRDSKEAEWLALLDVVERFCKPAGRDIYELLSMGLALSYPRATAQSLLRTRRWILKEAVLSWQRHGQAYLQHDEFRDRLSALTRSKPWLP